MEEPSLSQLLYMCLYGISMLLQSWVNNYMWTCPLVEIFIYFLQKIKINEVLASLPYLGGSFLSLFFYLFILIVGFQWKIKLLESIWDHPVSSLNANIRFLKLLLEFSVKENKLKSIINQSMSFSSHTHDLKHTHTCLNTLLMLSVFVLGLTNFSFSS